MFDVFQNGHVCCVVAQAIRKGAARVAMMHHVPQQWVTWHTQIMCRLLWNFPEAIAIGIGRKIAKFPRASCLPRPRDKLKGSVALSSLCGIRTWGLKVGDRGGECLQRDARAEQSDQDPDICLERAPGSTDRRPTKWTRKFSRGKQEPTFYKSFLADTQCTDLWPSVNPNLGFSLNSSRIWLFFRNVLKRICMYIIWAISLK
jgi:hypothetical protein